MTAETILTPAQVDSLLEGVLRASGSRLGNYTYQKTLDDLHSSIRAIEQAVLQSPEIQALRKDAVAVRRDTLLSVLGKLNSNPYNLTKSECVDVVREMFEEADAAMKQQK